MVRMYVIKGKRVHLIWTALILLFHIVEGHLMTHVLNALQMTTVICQIPFALWILLAHNALRILTVGPLIFIVSAGDVLNVRQMSSVNLHFQNAHFLMVCVYSACRQMTVEMALLPAIQYLVHVLRYVLIFSFLYKNIF